MMTGLFDPTRHEPLEPLPWNEAAAREAIRRIADSALAAYEPGLGWRAHPLDDPESPIDRFHNLYFGAGGVIWALRHLQQGGVIKALPDFTSFVATLREANRAMLAESQHGNASYLFGDAGLDLLHWTLQPSEALGQRLFDSVQSNVHNPVCEALWGNPGTVLAAIHMAEATGEARWTALGFPASRQAAAPPPARRVGIAGKTVAGADEAHRCLAVQVLYPQPGAGIGIDLHLGLQHIGRLAHSIPSAGPICCRRCRIAMARRASSAGWRPHRARPNGTRCCCRPVHWRGAPAR
jgi:hypothetical protein